jgi:hypothetical protein
MKQAGMPYKAKYGRKLKYWGVIGGATVICALGLLPGALWLSILDFGFFGGGALLMAITGLRGITVVRVDQAGITLCSSPLYPKSRTRLFPWEDVVAVIIWDRSSFSSSQVKVEYVGVERRPGAPPLTGKVIGQRSLSNARRHVPDIPPETVVTRATNGGLLDHGKLTAAVAHFGPGVRVVDLTVGRSHLGMTRAAIREHGRGPGPRLRRAPAHTGPPFLLWSKRRVVLRRVPRCQARGSRIAARMSDPLERIEAEFWR